MVWTERLRQASTTTFEEAAFCLVEAIEVGSREIDGARGAVRFDGPLSGFLLVEAEARTAIAATANMLGLDGEPPLELQRDALAEVANMICGHLVSEGGEEFGLFRLRPTDDDPPRGLPVADLVLELDCGVARVALWLDAPRMEP